MTSIEENNEIKYTEFKFIMQHKLKKDFEKFVMNPDFETYKRKELPYLYLCSLHDDLWFFETIIRLKPNTLSEKYKNGNILLFCLLRDLKNISEFLIETYPELLQEKINDHTFLHFAILKNIKSMYFRICDMFDFSYIVNDKTYFCFAISLDKMDQDIINSIYDKSEQVDYVSSKLTTLLMDFAKRGIYINNPKENDIAKIYDKNADGENILFSLAKGGINKIWDFVNIKKLVNCVNFKGKTPLHIAAQNSNLDFFIMIYLSSFKTIRQLKDKDGWNILSISLANINSQVSNFLLMEGYKKQKINDLKAFKDFNYSAIKFVFNAFEYDEVFTLTEILPIVEKCKNKQKQSTGVKRKRPLNK